MHPVTTPRMNWTEENRGITENEKASSLKIFAPCIERFINRGIYIHTHIYIHTYFIQENHIKQLNKDPADTYQKQIQQTIQKCNILVDKQAHKYCI